MNRGSSTRAMRSEIVRCRFNEAPIHESGKCLPSADPQASPTASMRPRFMNRGSGLGTAQHGVAHHGFNEAPIHESGKSRQAKRQYRAQLMLQ